MPSHSVRILGLLALFSVACATRYVAPGHVERSVFAAQVDPNALRAAIVEVLNVRRHTIESEEPSALITTLSGGGRDLTVRIEYDARGYALTPLHQTGFETQGEAGHELVSDRYMVWLHRLRVLIDRRIAEQRALEREQRAEAADRAVRVAQAEQQAEEARLERERLRTTPTYPAPGYGPGVAPSQGIRPGFNITRPPNGLGELSLVLLNQSAEPLNRLTLRRSGAEAWLPNQLVSPIAPGQSFTLTGIEAGSWEVRVETFTAFKAWHGLSFGAGGEYTVLVTTDGWTWL